MRFSLSALRAIPPFGIFAFALFAAAAAVAQGGSGDRARIVGASRSDDGHRATDEERSLVEVVDRALRAFRGFSDSDKREALRSLVDVGPAATEQLAASLEHLRDEPATWVARAFRQIRDPRASYPLMKRYTRGSDAFRGEVLAALGAIGAETAVPFLATALADPEASIRRAAATALGRIPTRRSMRTLLGALGDSDAWVRSEAVSGIRRMMERVDSIDPVETLIALVPELPRHGVADALALLAGTRRRAAYYLLLEQARLGDARARRVAVRGLGFQGRASARTVLESALDDSESEVRIEAVRALDVVCGRTCARPLVERLDREDSPRVRRELRRTLRAYSGRDFGDDAEPWLAWLRSDS